MKICIPTQGIGGLQEPVFGHFGSAGYFVIYDTESKELNTIKNSNDHHEHGQCHPLGNIEGYGIEVVLTNGMGKRAVQKLNAGGVKVFLLANDNVEEAIRKFESGQLAELTLDNACGGHEGGHQRGHRHLDERVH
jgi:predicted Fe-Mo cluster-binding NifX family protein